MDSGSPGRFGVFNGLGVFQLTRGLPVDSRSFGGLGVLSDILNFATLLRTNRRQNGQNSAFFSSDGNALKSLGGRLSPEICIEKLHRGRSH